MFLDEKLYLIGKNVDISNEMKVIVTIDKMLKECAKNFIREVKTDPYMRRKIIKRINNSWNLAVRKLQKENKDFVKIDGFFIFCKELYPEYL